MFVVTPFSYPLDAPIHIISNLKNPESHHIPLQFEQSLISELISVAQLAAPTSMIHFTIDLNVELSAIWEEDGQVQAIPVSRILRHCSDSSIVELLDATEVHDTPEEAVYLDGSLQVGGAFLYELWPGLFVFRGEPEEQGELKSVLRGH